METFLKSIRITYERRVTIMGLPDNICKVYPIETYFEMFLEIYRKYYINIRDKMSLCNTICKETYMSVTESLLYYNSNFERSDIYVAELLLSILYSDKYIIRDFNHLDSEIKNNLRNFEELRCAVKKVSQIVDKFYKNNNNFQDYLGEDFEFKEYDNLYNFEIFSVMYNESICDIKINKLLNCDKDWNFVLSWLICKIKFNINKISQIETDGTVNYLEPLEPILIYRILNNYKIKLLKFALREFDYIYNNKTGHSQYNLINKIIERHRDHNIIIDSEGSLNFIKLQKLLIYEKVESVDDYDEKGHKFLDERLDRYHDKYKFFKAICNFYPDYEEKFSFNPKLLFVLFTNIPDITNSAYTANLYRHLNDFCDLYYTKDYYCLNYQSRCFNDIKYQNSYNKTREILNIQIDSNNINNVVSLIGEEIYSNIIKEAKENTTIEQFNKYYKNIFLLAYEILYTALKDKFAEELGHYTFIICEAEKQIEKTNLIDFKEEAFKNSENIKYYENIIRKSPSLYDFRISLQDLFIVHEGIYKIISERFDAIMKNKLSNYLFDYCGVTEFRSKLKAVEPKRTNNSKNKYNSSNNLDLCKI